MVRARWLGRRAEPPPDAPAGAPPPWLAQEFRHDAARPGTWSSAPGEAPLEVADPPFAIAAGKFVLIVPNPAPGPPWAVAFVDC